MRFRQKLFQSASFLDYWLRAVNEHALHPPFIFNLYTKAIKSEQPNELFGNIEDFRRKLLNDHSLLCITDLGAGSSQTTSRERKISEIARHSLTRPRFSKLLFRLIRYLGASQIIELGTSLGINTLYLSAAAPEGKIYTLEGCPQTAGVARQVFDNWPTQNILLKKGNIDVVLPELLNLGFSRLDAAYLDANHTYDATIRYFNYLLPFLHDNSFVVVDDIYWSAGMKKAWLEIRQHERVSMSIDLFDAGILFFKAGIQKTHYILEF